MVRRDLARKLDGAQHTYLGLALPLSDFPLMSVQCPILKDLLLRRLLKWLQMSISETTRVTRACVVF